MTKEELVDHLVTNEWMWADHSEQGIEGVTFKREFNGKDVKYHLTNEGIKQLGKEELLKKIKSHDVYGVSRVVGYFARIGNWNNSKLGELKDRRRGTYQVER